MTASKRPEESLSVESFASSANGQMIPVTNTLSYCSLTPQDDLDLQRLVHDPVSATPPALARLFPRIGIVLAPYLEKPHGKADAPALLSFKKPPNTRRLFSTHVDHEGQIYVFVAAKDEDIADYHDALYYELATLIVDRAEDDFVTPFVALLRDELKNEVRGEVDDESWRLKDQLLSRQADPLKDTKTFRAYAREAMIETLTLYLHGLCCDLDIEAGPRQLASPHLRKRLELLRSLLPPPEGVAVFPEELPVA